jgi:threonylcarbamoyladenosine tRNA methylthiotransferase MtaB
LPKTAAAYTLGCKTNQYDTNQLLHGLTARGFTITGFNEKADVYIINTCAVTHTGEKKSLQMIRRAKEKNADAKIAVCGCVATLNKGDICADFIFDAREPEPFFAWLDMPVNELTHVQPNIKGRTRAYIKIQDGCDRFCAYCIVPYARGPVKSRPLYNIINEAENHIANGVNELVLTGIQISAYGKDVTDGVTFPDVIKKIAVLPGLSRLRLGSIEPYAINDRFIEAIQIQTVCNHFHLSLQSGCDATLARMNRRYTTAEYAAFAQMLQAAKQDTALTTDIIVGFPGETDGEFEQTKRFAEEIGFAKTHVFEYSPREGTPAAAFPGQVPNAVKKARGKEMHKTAMTLQHKFLSEYIGETVEVLFEAKRNGLWEGHTANYIAVRAPKGEANRLMRVQLTHIDKGIAYGQ